MNISGQLSLFGIVELNVGNQTIEFYSGTTLPAITTGSFAPLGAWPALVWQNEGTDISWNNLGQNSDLFCGSDCLFVTTFNGNTAWFNVNSYTLSTLPEVPLVLTGTGTMSLTGSDATFGDFTMSAQIGNFGEYSSWQAFTYLPQPHNVPAPIIGAGFSGIVVLITLVLARIWKL